MLDAPKAVESRQHLIGLILAIALEVGLLIHQVGELHERIGGEAEQP